MDYYKKQSRFTEIRKQAWIIEKIIPDFPFLMRCVKSILIHPIDASRQKVKFDRSKNGLFHAQNTTVERILDFPALQPYLDQNILPLATTPQDRAVLSCDHHALLFASLLRYQGFAVRLKTGFAKYIVKGRLIPHWIVEVYNNKTQNWKWVDPERCIEDLNKSDFLSIEKCWGLFKNEKEEAIPSYSGLKGMQGIKYGLLSQVNCIFKNELLSYEWRLSTYGKEKPEIMKRTYQKLSPEQRSDIEEMAIMLIEPDTNINELWNFYTKHGLTDGTEKPEIA